MKVVVMCSSFVVGGAENMVAQLVAGLDKEKFDVVVLTSNPRENNHIQDLVDASGVKTYYYSSSKKSVYSRIKNFVRINSILKKERPDIVHTNLSIVVYVLPYVLFHRVKLIHTVHNIPNKDLGRGSRFLLKILVKLKKIKFSSISRIIQKEIVKEYNVGESLCPVIVNPVDCKKYEMIAVQSRNREKGVFHFVSVGRLSNQKNHMLLIQAFKKVVEKKQNVLLTIAGDGLLRGRLTDYVHRMALDDRVIFLGEIADVPNLLAQCDAFVLSSDYEGLPLTLLEAMAAGLPIISTNVGGVSDIVINEKNGLLVPSKNSDLLADSMVRLISDLDLRKKLLDNAPKMAKQYDISCFIDKYTSLYME